MSRVRTTINFGITVPKPAFERLEKTRGCYSRIKFILMALDSLAQKIEKQSVQAVQVCRHDQPVGGVSQNPEGVYEHYE